MAPSPASGLRLYNTLTRAKEDFRPIDPAHVRLYVCGPTVYDHAHIGNARPVIVFDVLYRLLRQLYGADHVTYARNITDVDDKINARAAQDFPDLPLNQAIARVTATTEAQFHADVAALGCLEPDAEPRATEHIAAMRALIERLVARGVAYVAEAHVLFAVAAMERLGGVPRYGALARRSLDEMLAGARVDVAPYKRDAMDFVLWKPSQANEPGWPSPCGIAGLGRPGWHIECSAMSMAKLLEPFGGGLACDDPSRNVFDIHGGGIDLVFPHHENEVAQSCCAFGSPRMANFWLHNGFLQVEGEKMSKSLGNFVTINELLRYWPGDVLRLNMLKTKYRQPIDWRESQVEKSCADLLKWTEVVAEHDVSDEYLKYLDRGNLDALDRELVEALSDDLNTPQAIARLHAIVRQVEDDELDVQVLVQNLKFMGFRNLNKPGYFHHDGTLHIFESGPQPDRDTHLKIHEFKAAKANANEDAASEALADLNSSGFILDMNDSGVVSVRNHTSADWRNTQLINDRIKDRTAARAAKNWAESDRIRDELLAMGIALKDNKDGTTTWEVKR